MLPKIENRRKLLNDNFIFIYTMEGMTDNIVYPAKSV